MLSSCSLIPSSLPSFPRFCVIAAGVLLYVGIVSRVALESSAVRELRVARGVCVKEASPATGGLSGAGALWVTGDFLVSCALRFVTRFPSVVVLSDPSSSARLRFDRIAGRPSEGMGDEGEDVGRR